MIFDAVATAEYIAKQQLRNGCIPHFEDAVADPWNHVEAAMGLDSVGHHAEARRAYEWLMSVQRPDGAWAAAYRGDVVEDHTLDANFTAYAAAGLWHHYVATSDVSFLERNWYGIDRAVEFVLALQTSDGAVLWARDAHYEPWPLPLLTATSCIYLSLRCAVAIAETVGDERPDWELAADSVASAIRDPNVTWADKRRFSMDWYYPVLAGAVTGDDADAVLASRWDVFVVEGLGTRCVSDRPWITSGETSELILALDVAGHKDEAEEMFQWLQHLQADGGGYWMGANFPGAVVWPRQQPTWAAGSVLLAYDALERATATSGFFRGETFPEPVSGLVDPL
ncbi:MAG: prenyltransferase [Actinobacteria bacterium]|nr:prenyltransferase [Actinomycetota bacterium]